MNRSILNLMGISIICTACLIGWAAFQVGTIFHRLTMPDLTATVAKANAALDTVNHPCAPGPCGTLANIDKLTVKVGDLAVTSQRQVAQTDVLVTSVAADVQRTGETMERTGASAQRTLDAATGTLQQAQADLQTANGTIASFQPLLASSNATVTDFDALLKANATNWTLTSGNVQQMTAHGAGILFDVQKETDAYVAPKTKAQKIWSYAPVTLKLGAEIGCLSFGVPCP